MECGGLMLWLRGAGEGSNRRVSYRDMLVHDDEDDAEMDINDDESPEATPPPPLRRPVCSSTHHSFGDIISPNARSSFHPWFTR